MIMLIAYTLDERGSWTNKSGKLHDVNLGALDHAYHVPQFTVVVLRMIRQPPGSRLHIQCVAMQILSLYTRPRVYS